MKTPSWHGLLKESAYLAYYIHGLHIVVIVSLIYFPLTDLLLIVLCLVISAHWYYALKRLSPKASSWIQRIDFCDEHWSLIVQGQAYPVRLEQATVWPWLVTMSFARVDNKRRKYSCVIFADSMNSDAQRQLRIMLRHFQVWT